VRIPDAIAPLREREFRLLFCGQSISLIGDNLAPIALAFAILDDDGSATDVGVVYAANILARVAFMLVGGVWADRLSRRRVMLAADAARALCTGVLAVAVMTAARRSGSTSRWSRCTASAPPSSRPPRPGSCRRP